MEDDAPHDQSVSNPPTPSQHRMPTVSAAQALQNLLSSPHACISTGLQQLDDAMRDQNLDVLGSRASDGGISRGQVTEVYGPPGVGKTTLGLQLTANTLQCNEGVVWVDAASPVSGPRLTQILSPSGIRPVRHQHSSLAESALTGSMLENLHHFMTPTLPHLVALLCHESYTFPPPNTSLIVIDALSSLIASAYPRNLDSTNTSKKIGAAQKYDPPLWAASRKWSVLQYIISSLQKLATLRNIVVVILTQSITKMQSGSGAVLIPAVSSTAWDSGIATRIVLFRDWGWEKTQVRFARIVKASGTSTKGREGVGRIIPFVIDDRGLQEVQTPESTSIVTTSMTGILGRKRKADDIRDSEDEDDLEGSDEDYGWAEDDVEKLPPPPSQWQGSEDILFPLPDDRAEDEEQEHFLDDEDEDEVVVVRTGASNEDDSREDLHDGDAHRASYG